MSEELPSINDFIEDRSNLPSVETFTEGTLPVQKSIVDKNEETITQVIREQPDNTALIVNLIENVRNSIPEVKSYDQELYDIVKLIEQLQNNIEDSKTENILMESNEFDRDVLREELNDIRSSIPTVPEVRYYDKEIKELQEATKREYDYGEQYRKLTETVLDVRDRANVDHSWIRSTFSNIDDNFDSVSSSLSTMKGKLEMDVSDMLETLETFSFENKVDKDNLNKKLEDSHKEFSEATEQITSHVVDFKDSIYNELKEASLRIWNINNEYKNDDKELKKHIKEQYEVLKESISQVLKEGDSKYKSISKYFDGLKEEVKLLPESFPEVKYYDDEIEKVNESVKKVDESVKSVQNLVEVLENKLNKKIAGLKESILVVPPTDNNTDPLTPLDQNFATLDDLSSHYRLFLNRIQQQLATLGGGGEVRLEFLDDVDRTTAKVDGKFLKYDAASDKWVGATGGSGGGADTATVRDAIQGYYGYTTDFYTVGVANTVQEIGAGVTTLIQPQVAAVYQYMPTVMSGVSTNPYVGTGATIGTGQTEFSLAGLSSGASCIVRTALAFNPDDNNSNLDIQLKFTTNTTTQGTGLKHFTIKKEQALIMNEGAGQQYISENLFNFFVGTTLEGTAQSDAGSFNIEVIPTSEGELEVLAVTVNVTT